AAVIAEAAGLDSEPDVVRRRTVARLRRELQRIGRRDFFPPAEREHAHRAVERAAKMVTGR
ncbi:MAG TPA: hypothetical protein VKD67_05905, partial [Acidimicrobiales bacterium]|nr:hypothetical protein [Acidimicrobiales bacterium]